MNYLTLPMSAAKFFFSFPQVSTSLNILHSFELSSPNYSKSFVRSYSAQKTVESCHQFNKSKKEEIKFNPVTHVIFDLDGTILNTEEIYFCASKKYLKRVFKKDLTWELYSMVMGTGSKDAAVSLIKELKLPINADIYLHGIWQELRITMPDAQILPGVERLVDHLYKCKIPIGLATSSSIEMFNLKSKNHEEFFKKFCSMVFAGSEPKLTGRNKPHPDIFYFAARRFPVQPEKLCRVLVFEDSIMGVRGALAANMQVVMTPSPRVPEHLLKLVQPTLTLKDLCLFDPIDFHLPPF